MSDPHNTSVPLWQQLQAVAQALAQVRRGVSGTAAVDAVPAALRPGVQALLFQVLRQLGRAQALRAQLASRTPAPLPDALLCTALALAWDPAQAPYEPYTLVNQAVEAAKKNRNLQAQANFLNACLRRFLRERDALVAATDADGQAQWNHPVWWVKRLQQDHPAHWQDILRANNQAAPMTLRVNTQRVSRDALQAQWAQQGLMAQPVGQQGLVLAHALPVRDIPGFAEGLCSVQDAAAQCAAQLLLDGMDTSAPLRILDACAAPGGSRLSGELGSVGEITAGNRAGGGEAPDLVVCNRFGGMEANGEGFRAELVDASTDSLGSRIRRAKLQKVPYVLVVGDEDERELELLGEPLEQVERRFAQVAAGQRAR